MKIYAITKGCYSGYHICALTTSKAKAERLKEIYTDKWDEAEIEEFEDGDSEEEIRVCWYYCVGTDEVKPSDYFWQERVVATKRTGEVKAAYVIAPDAEHARKKAQDMIAQYQAEKEGIC